MKRTVSVLGFMLGLSICSVAGWFVAQPPRLPFPAPDAARVEETRAGVWAWQISYDAPGEPFAWYWAAARALEARGWAQRQRWRPDRAGATQSPVVLARFERIALGLLRDEIVLDPDPRHPNRARIHIRRQVARPGWRFSDG